MKYNLKNINIIALIFSVSMFLLSKSYFTWHSVYFNKIILFLVILLSLLNARRLSKHDILIIPLFIFYMSYIGFAGGYNVLGFIALFSVIYILLIKKENILLYFKYFKYIFCISLFLSLLSYILIVILNLNLPFNLIPSLNPIKGIDYCQYLFLVSEGPIGLRYLNIRFFGMFDEPGVVGSFVSFFLLADRFNLRSKQNIILFIAGVLSFSLFFYINVLIYLLYISNNKSRFYIILASFLIFFMTKNNAIVNTLVWDRFSIVQGKMKGDNRSSTHLDNTYRDYLHTPDLLTGKGTEFASQNFEGSSSYKTIIVAYGLPFFVSIVLAFSLYAYFSIKKTKYVLAYLFLVFGMLYHRPSYMHEPTLFFVLISTIYALEHYSKQENQNLKRNDKLVFSRYFKNKL